MGIIRNNIPQQGVVLGFNGEYRWLSNFYPVKILYEGFSYPSVEHAYVAAKTIDPNKRRLISNMTAGYAKKYGRQIQIRDDWDDVKSEIMFGLLAEKFSQKKFINLLLSTNNMYLEETNTWGDTYWGVCNGVGENQLGKMLMNIRSTLQEMMVQSNSLLKE